MSNTFKSPAAFRAAFRLASPSGISRLALLALAAGTLAGCRPESPDTGPRVEGWMLVEPRERHPILVSEQPVTTTVRVSRGAYGLTEGQRNRIGHFLNKYRTVDRGNAKLVVSVPSGTANEVASMHAASEIRQMISDAGFPSGLVAVEPYRGAGSRAPIRVSYMRVVAEGPQCGEWPTNLSSTTYNLSYHNMACADQKNLAAMVANPSDLVSPQTMDPRTGDARRRDHFWNNYIKGESTVTKKAADEKISTKSE